jgi:hypothetical protein
MNKTSNFDQNLCSSQFNNQNFNCTQNSISVQSLSNPVLHQNLKALCDKEKNLLHEILSVISKIDQTRLYLTDFGYPSLFEYLVKEIGYSPASAQRRIDGARLLNQVPELGEKIKEGGISLTQVSKMQQMMRQAKKETGEIIKIEDKKALLEKIENKSPQETEVILSQSLKIEAKSYEVKWHQRDDSVRFEITLSKSQSEDLELVKSMMGASTAAEVLEKLMTRYLKSKGRDSEKQKQKKDQTYSHEEVVVQQKAEQKEHLYLLATMGLAQKNTEPLSQKIIKEVYKRDHEQCTHEYMTINPITKQKVQRRCSSKKYLHIDHIIQREFGGSHDLSNLRLLCGAHHRERHG